MVIKIHLDNDDAITGGGLGVQLGENTVIFFPVDQQQALRLCDELVEAVQDVRQGALRALATR